MIFVS